MKQDRPLFRCSVCDQPVTRDGVVFVSYNAMDDHEDGELELARRAGGGGCYQLSDLEGLAPLARWTVVHDRCGTAEGRVYGVPIERIQTWRAVASWSAHLSMKGWFQHTDWAGLMRAAGADEEANRRARKSIGARLRWMVFSRDGFRCRYCGAAAAEGAELHVDHVIPHADGGSDDIDNLCAACRDCNLGKGRLALPAGAM